MPKNQTSFTLKGNLDISDITKGIEQLRAKIQSSELGAGLTAGLTKDLNAIQKKFETAFKNLPGVGATSKQVDTFATKIYDAAEDLNLLAQKMKDFGATDKYIKENIGSIQKFANALSDASRKAQEAKAALKENFQFQDTDPDAKIKTIHKEHTGKMRTAANAGDIVTLRKEYDELTSKIQSRITESQEKGDTTREQALLKVLEQLRTEWAQLLPLAEQVKASFDAQTKAQEDYTKAFQKSADNIDTNKTGIVDDLNDIKDASEKVGDEAVETAQDLKKIEEANSVLDNVQRRMKDLFSTATIFSTIRRIVRGAIQDFQELDKQFNEIAIVSNYSTKEMWSSFSDVNKVAQEFGVQTKNVLEVQNLYYHQGKDMAEVNKLTAQTLTLAKITGMDYERATSDLTAALNAYNIAAEDAVRVTDTIAAMDTNAAISSEELMTALTKTASIAANAGMSLESTEVFLTKMIETTREAPENLGTALKTIIARFGEVKQEIDGQEVELADINRVDTALKSIGISLLDTAGQIRDLDGVFMELSSKWDDLDRNTQRYIATIAAGSRQQSRFIAMMEDYDRTLELTEIAQNSAGLGAKQLAKSQESIESSLNRLKSSWQEFYSGFITSGMIKGVLDLANGFLGLLNNLNKVSPALSLVVIGLTGWLIKAKLIDGAIGNFSEKLVKNVVALTGQKLAVDDNIKSNGILATLLSLLSKTTDDTTKEILEDTSARIAHSKAIDLESKSLKKQSLIPNGITKDTPIKGEKGVWELGKKSGKDSVAKILGDKKFSSFKGGAHINLKAIQNLKSSGGIKALAPGLFGEITSAIKGVIGVIGKISGIISSVVTTLGGPVIAAILGVIAAITAASIAWKTFNQSLDDTKQVEKLQKAQENYNNSLKEYKDLKEKVALVQKNNLKKNLSEEEFTKNQEAIKALVDEYPKYLDYIDEEGNYHLKNVEALDEEIKKKQQLLDMDASQLTGLRTVYAQKGIYADESTQAGKAMANLQKFASAMGEDQLEEIANEIDAGLTGFNKSAWYDAMEAYASGEKTSFDNKDFSTLFAGDIGEQNWQELLTTIADESSGIFDESGKIVEENLADALQKTGAYGAASEEASARAKDVARAFTRLSNQTGGLYADLLRGAAEEFDNIVIQNAVFQIEKADLGTSGETNDAIAEVIAESVGELTTGDKIKDWFASTDMGKAFGVTGATQEKTEAASKAYIDAFSILTESQIENLDKVFTSQNLGGISNEKIKELSQKEGEELLTGFFEALGEDVTSDISLSKESIENMSDEVIKAYEKVILDTIENYNVNSKLEKFNDVKEYLSGDEQAKLDALAGELSADQTKALLSTLSSMKGVEQAQYLKGIFEELDKVSGEVKENITNIFLGANVSTPEGIIKLQEDLIKLGYTGEEVTRILNNLGLLDNLKLDSLEDLDQFSSQTERFSNSMESMTSLLEGTATDDQLESFLTTMVDNFKRLNSEASDKEIIDYLGTLSQSIVATADGYKINETAALQYGETAKQSLLELIKTHIDYLYTLIQTGKATVEQVIAYHTLTQQYSKWTAQVKKARLDGLKKDLEKAKEKADELVESLKELVNWLMEFDRFANLDNISEGLENDFGHLEYEIEFSTNADVIKGDIEDQVKNINTQIAVNQGGLRAAEDEKTMRRDVIEKNYSDYVSFDANGKAIVDAQKMQKLQEQIAKADETRKPALQAEADLIMDSVDAYNSAEDAVEKYSSALEDNFSDLEKVLKDNYQAIIDMEEKLIEVRQEAEDKELEAVKDKYDAIKEENDKYLDSVREMIDEERRIRDRANQEQDVKDKEKKLAMMKMDTSGIYASDIRALEKELERDYQDLEDSAVDREIDKLEKDFKAEAEQYDKEIEYMENSLEYKREIMTEYNQWATNLVKSGSDEMLAYLKANDEEYYTSTAAQQAQWELQWTSSAARAEAAHELMAEGLIEDVSKSLEICKESAGGFDEAVTTYSQNAIASNGEIEGSVESLTEYYYGLAQGVSGVTSNINSLRNAYISAANAAAALKAAQDAVIYGDTYTGNVVDLKDNPSYYNPDEGYSRFGHGVTLQKGQDPTAGTNYTTDTQWYVMGRSTQMGTDGYEYTRISSQKDGKGSWAFARVGDGAHEISRKLLEKNTKAPRNLALYYAYAKGGYVDYTGPAWVDGTKSHPEYMLNATQTQQFETLVAALSSMFTNGNTPISQTSQKIGDAVYNFHIKVDQMSSDYDVDQLIDRIEEKMIKASQYRNVTLVKKTK